MGQFSINGHAALTRELCLARSIVSRLLIAVACAGSLVACGGGGSSGASVPSANTCSVSAQKNWVHNSMDDLYYWRDQVTSALNDSLMLVSEASALSYFKKLLWGPPAGKDRFSFVISEADLNLAQSGQSMGYGISWIGESVNACRSIRVKYVQPGSPADLAGVQRGDTLSAVNNTATPACQGWNQAQFDAGYPATVVTTLFDFTAVDGSRRTVSLTSGIVDEDPVLVSKVITGSDNRPVGYLMFNTFMATKGRDQLITAFQQFRTQAVQDLVLDLRYNGGGLVSISADLATMIAGAAAKDKTFLSYKYNNRNQALDGSFTFPVDSVPAAAQLGLTRVYVLTTANTASASELVINGLKPVLKDVIQIGLTTYGKPVGMLTSRNCGEVYFAINFEMVNADGVGGYFDGIAPSAGCNVSDNLSAMLGDTTEPMLAAAIRHRASGSCATAAAMLRQRSAEPVAYPLRDDPIKNNMYLLR